MAGQGNTSVPLPDLRPPVRGTHSEGSMFDPTTWPSLFPNSGHGVATVVPYQSG